MPVYKLKVIKKPLTEKIPDIKPNFSKLDNLHLELLENKKKIRQGLPLIPIRKTIVKSAPQPPPQPKSNEKNNISQGAENKNISQQIEDDLIKELGMDNNEVFDDSVNSFPANENGRTEDEDGVHGDEVRENGRTEDENEVHENEVHENEPQLNPEEQEEEDRQEYLVRFKILKKSHPNYDFPSYTEHTNLHTLKRLYNDTFRMINLDMNVDNYRFWLSAGFLGIEMIAGKAGFDFKGFAKFQSKKMEKYERLLVELGEKSYSNFASNWPVEIRLIGIILLDAGIFYLGKIVADHAGEGVADLFSMLFGIPTSNTVKEKKHKMRGPTTRPDEIRNMNKSD